MSLVSRLAHEDVVVDRPHLGFRWGMVGEDFVAHWTSVLELRASRSGKLKEIAEDPTAPRALVEKVRRGPATAFLRVLAGRHSLHASAVAYGRTALACLGESGTGKSTLAMTLCQMHGTSLLADDVAHVDRDSGRWWVQPVEADVWLHSETDPSSKRALSLRTAERPAALTHIVALRFDEAAPEPRLERLRGGQAVAPLMQSLVRFDLTEIVLSRDLDTVAALVGEARVYELQRSHRTPVQSVATLLARLLGDNP